MPADSNPDLALVLADPQRIADLRPDHMPVLLGALEQLRACLWSHMLRAPAPASREAGVDAGNEVLTVPEVAAELRFTSSYVYEAVRRGDLTAVRKGKYVRVRRSDLRTWLNGHPPNGLDARRTSRDSARHAFTPPGPPSPSSRRARVSRGAHFGAPPAG